MLKYHLDQMEIGRKEFEDLIIHKLDNNTYSFVVKNFDQFEINESGFICEYHHLGADLENNVYDDVLIINHDNFTIRQLIKLYYGYYLIEMEIK